MTVHDHDPLLTSWVHSTQWQLGAAHLRSGTAAGSGQVCHHGLHALTPAAGKAERNILYRFTKVQHNVHHMARRMRILQLQPLHMPVAPASKPQHGLQTNSANCDKHYRTPYNNHEDGTVIKLRAIAMTIACNHTIPYANG